MVGLAVVGKFAATTAFSSMNLYLAELFPTEIRSRGITMAFMISRLGAILAPFIIDLLVGWRDWRWFLT